MVPSHYRQCQLQRWQRRRTMPEPTSHDDYRPSAEFEQELQELQTQID